MHAQETTDPAITSMREDMNRLRGRLFGALEAVGLPDKQENAVKGLVRTLTYEIQASLEATLRGRGTSDARGTTDHS